MKRIMIFASGGGSNFIAIHKNILKGEISNANTIRFSFDSNGIV